MAIVGTSVLVSGCVSTSPDNGPQQNSGEYCIIEFPPDQGFTHKDYLRFNVGFYEPSNPDSEHRVIIKNEFGSVVNPDNISKYSTSTLISGVTLNRRLSNGGYTMEVREKAVDLIFGDEGKSCEVDLYLGTDGGPRDENGNPIIPDGQDYSEFYSEALPPDPFLEPDRDIAVGGDQGEGAQGASVIVREIGSPFSPREDIRINNGRHGKNGSAVDLALLERVKCNKGVIAGDGPLKDWTVVATESGQVQVIGGKEKTDPNHSVIVIKSNEGKVGYMHIEPLESLNNKVKNGDKNVEKGEPIGKVTCEYPPGGDSTGFHVHLFTISSDGAAEPFSANLEGWTFGINPQNGETIATKGDETRYVCGGICNSGERKNVLPIGNPNASDPKPREPRATEKPNPQKRIEAILSVEPGDSDEQAARKMILSKFFNALNSSQSSQTDNYGNTDRVLDVSVTNLESWESNIARLLSGESVDNDPLKISFVSTYEGWQHVERRVGRGEIDNISFYIEERDLIISDLDKKNGAQTWAQTWFRASISYFERSQALQYEGRIYDDKERKEFLDIRTVSDNLPKITEWTEETIYFSVGPNAKEGEWHTSVNYGFSGMSDKLEYQGGWEGIDLVTRMFNYPSCNYQANYDSGWARYEGCVLKDIDDN